MTGRFDAPDGPYVRDYEGYGRSRPALEWPGAARVALSIVLNYEEGAERTILNDDDGSEPYLTEVPVRAPRVGARDLNVESGYDYGARVGVWRLLDLLGRYEQRVTVFAVGMALEKNPAAGRAFVEAGHELASHHYRWIDYSTVPEAVEREHLRRSIEVIRELSGVDPVGFYGGRVSERSRRLAMETGVFRYDSDAYDDDVPYWVRAGDRMLLVIPYTLDANDVKFLSAPGFSTASEFATYLRDALDALRKEETSAPRVMSVGLHCRISGRPGRIAGIRAFLEHALRCSDVWIATRAEIAEYCRGAGDLRTIELPS
jgi:peptidoglycan/xylan/chitin deacetylase (PgdA/CDA1 family)